jgi:aminoglycoside N3'-acetyltransferase
MLETTELNLSNHFINDLGIQPDDLVFMFSGIFGLGKLENGLQTIESAMQRVLPKGTLIIPTFSYSWSQGERFDKNTKCPEMGSFSNYVLGLPNYVRTNNPNFSVSIRVNDYNKKLVDYFLDISNDCFGDGSIFAKVVEYSQKNRAWILLLGGAFNDVKYRSTFIHYAQQKVGVPHRYVKSFYSPDDSKIYIKQLVRCLSEEEFLHNRFRKVEGLKFRFPIEENYYLYGKDIESAGLLTQKDFGYYPSRMVSVKDSVNYYIEKIKVNPYYCIDKSSFSL